MAAEQHKLIVLMCHSQGKPSVTNDKSLDRMSIERRAEIFLSLIMQFLENHLQILTANGNQIVQSRPFYYFKHFTSVSLKCKW